MFGAYTIVRDNAAEAFNGISYYSIRFFHLGDEEERQKAKKQMQIVLNSARHNRPDLEYKIVLLKGLTLNE